MNLNEAEVKITEWHHDKGLINGSNAWTQTGKLLEEFTEVVAAQLAGRSPFYILCTLIKMLIKLFVTGRIKSVLPENAEYEYKDGLGDMVVVQVNLAAQKQSTLTECVNGSYNVISKRKGRKIGGIFVKESDL